MALGFQQAT